MVRVVTDAPDSARTLVAAAFGDDFGEDDWQHALGGVHVVLERDGLLLAHAAVVPRELHVAGVPLLAGYLEAVAVERGHQRQGLGSRVLEEVSRVVRDDFELGALSTGAHRFYERAGWERWQGPTYVRTAAGEVRTPEEDDAVMVLRCRPTSRLDLTAPISCPAREGDDW